MNCYYSNLIEGHDTRPVDIERALRADLAAEPKRRNLQLEAAAHIAVQGAIDTGELDGFIEPSALAIEIHRRFYERMPHELRFVEERGGGRYVEMLPGQLRDGHVEVGHHIAPPPQELPGWLSRLTRDNVSPYECGIGMPQSCRKDAAAPPKVA